jgi:hypothetical protein
MNITLFFFFQAKKVVCIKGDNIFKSTVICARPTHNNKVAGGKKMRIFFPGPDFPESIQTHDKEEFGPVFKKVIKIVKGLKKVGVARPLKFDFRNFKKRVAQSGKLHHFKTELRRGDAGLFVRRNPGRDKDYFRKIEFFANLLG